MSPNPYTEHPLVEQPAIAIFASLGWQILSATGEILGIENSPGRETKGDVVLAGRLRAALAKFNPSLPPEAIQCAVDELSRDRSAMSLEAANREIYRLLKDGVSVSIPDREHGGHTSERVRAVNWDEPGQNDFLLVSQLSIVGNLYLCRPDLIGFVNGLPWLVIEVKKPGVPVSAAFEKNLTHYKQQIAQLFWYNALLLVSNGSDSRIGSLTADWERFFEWKRIEREDEPRRVSLEVLLRGTCDKARLLDIAENFTLFSEHKAGLVKIVGQNHQFLGVNNAIASMLEARRQGHGRGGVFWQTQGSGKSFSMVFFAQKVLRKVSGNWTFVVVSDRAELDIQIAKTFKGVGAVSQSEGEKCHANSGAHLRELLRENHRYVFTLIHKFQTPDVLTEREDVVVLTDEAHRSQYDTLALNMRAAMPKAIFLAFTGTPLIAGEERTKEVFGDYVSVYDFQQSVDDGATVRLFYENRTPELELVNPELNDELYTLIEEAGLDEAQETKLEKLLGRRYHLITRDERLDTVARDIVGHFLGRGFMGKAMVVSIDKATALRMFDKVKKHWGAELERAERELEELLPGRRENESRAQWMRREERIEKLKTLLDVLKTTDMAVIVSPGQNEIEQMKKLGLNIEIHRRRMNESEPGLDEKFKDTEDPLRLVFVCAMWLTGFDAPSCSAVYLDKPMRNHTLMQTIARANRVFPGKQSGVIVDYANVFASLERALAIYGMGQGGANPVKEKAQLVKSLRDAIAAITVFCGGHGVDLGAIEALPLGGVERLEAVDDAVDALIAPEPVRQDFFGYEKLVGTLFRAVKPDVSALEFAERVAGIGAIAESIRAKLNPNPPDVSAVMGQIGMLLDRSIRGLNLREDLPPPIDLSKIDFEALARRFQGAKHKNTELEALKSAIRAKIETLLMLNRTRANYIEEFEALIASYNEDSRNIEELFEELLTFSKRLNEEQERHRRENCSEEELTIFDILTRPAPELSEEERGDLKHLARELLQRMKGFLVLNWRQKKAARSALKVAIENMLDEGLPKAYTQEMFREKCAAMFEHMYESYPERDAGVYAKGV